MGKEQKPPKNTQRIMCVADLPQDRSVATYEIQNGDQKPNTVTLCKRQRQVMDLLLQAPVYCASPVRISDVVHIMKRDISLHVDTEMFPGDDVVGSGSYGVYFLKSRVRPLINGEAG